MTESSLPQQPDDDLPDYGLMSDEANARVHVLVHGVAAAVASGEVERNEALVALSDGVREISAAAPEVTDITVRDAILRELKPVFDTVGWEVPEPFEF